VYEDIIYGILVITKSLSGIGYFRHIDRADIEAIDNCIHSAYMVFVGMGTNNNLEFGNTHIFNFGYQRCGCGITSGINYHGGITVLDYCAIGLAYIYIGYSEW
jgi:hypothetical protein